MDSKELIKALDNLVAEKNISPDVVFEALQLALQTAYKKNFNSKTNVKVDINRDTGEIKVYSYLVVVDKYDDGHDEEDEEGNIKHIEPVINRDAQILLEDAEKIVPGIKLGETIEREVTPADFGRVAAGTAKQVVMQKIREAEKASIIDEFADKQDELMLGMVALEDQKNYYIDLGNVSISTKYFDIYILKKSLKINHLEEEWEEFLRGYNIDDYNEIYMRWMELIELSYN